MRSINRASLIPVVLVVMINNVFCQNNQLIQVYLNENHQIVSGELYCFYNTFNERKSDTISPPLNIDSLILDVNIDSLSFINYDSNNEIRYSITKTEGTLFSNKYPFNFTKNFIHYENSEIVKIEYSEYSAIDRNITFKLEVLYSKGVPIQETLIYNSRVISSCTYYSNGNLKEQLKFDSSGKKKLHENYDENGEIVKITVNLKSKNIVIFEKNGKAIEVTTLNKKKVW